MEDDVDDVDFSADLNETLPKSDLIPRTRNRGKKPFISSKYCTSYSLVCSFLIGAEIRGVLDDAAKGDPSFVPPPFLSVPLGQFHHKNKTGLFFLENTGPPPILAPMKEEPSGQVGFTLDQVTLLRSLIRDVCSLIVSAIYYSFPDILQHFQLLVSMLLVTQINPTKHAGEAKPIFELLRELGHARSVSLIVAAQRDGLLLPAPPNDAFFPGTRYTPAPSLAQGTL